MGERGGDASPIFIQEIDQPQLIEEFYRIPYGYTYEPDKEWRALSQKYGQ